jgi:hypothetical protein
MLTRYAETICWLTRHEAAGLVITPFNARVVDKHHHADGVQLTAARALQQPERLCLFSVEVKGAAGERKLMRLNERGAAYHAQLVARRKCSCVGPARAH